VAQSETAVLRKRLTRIPAIQEICCLFMSCFSPRFKFPASNS
jgi:hypothetical protein